MGDENRFKKLELRAGQRPDSEESPAEKPKKQRLRELDRKLNLDAVVDKALSQEQDSTAAFERKLMTVLKGVCAVSLIFFLASHHLFGVDGMLGFLINLTQYVLVPIGLLYWALSKSN
jgi:hypothetical protein